MNRFALIVAGAVVLTGGLSSQVAAAQSSAVINKSTQEAWLVQKGSPDFNRIQAFLLAQSTTAHSFSASNLTLDKLGNFTVRISSSGAGRVAPYDEGDPPVEPPDGGGNSPGDTWSVSTCGAGARQTWTWTYVDTGDGGGAWVLTTYSYQHVKSCSPN